MKGILVSVLFVILTCHGTRADELLLSPNLNESSRTLIPCGDNSDCESYQDGLCQDGFCECNGTRFCEDKVETVVTKIGEFCKVDADCNIEHSVCKDDKCACEEGRVDSSDGRKCLMIAEALGSTCEESVQCYKKILHSGCQHEKCVCQQQMHEYDGACYKNVALGEKCEMEGECSATPFSKCIDEKCTCKEGYVQNKVANRCLDIQTKTGGPCYEDIQCSTKLGKAYCKVGHCHCAELYQFKFSKSMCVRDMLLGESCENHTDCHGPEEGESRSECILGECKCKSEYYEEHGFCTSGEMSCVHIPSVLLFLVSILCICFYDNDFVVWGTLAYSIFYMFWITFLGRYFTDNNNYMDDQYPKSD